MSIPLNHNHLFPDLPDSPPDEPQDDYEDEIETLRAKYLDLLGEADFLAEQITEGGDAIAIMAASAIITAGGYAGSHTSGISKLLDHLAYQLAEEELED